MTFDPSKVIPQPVKKSHTAYVPENYWVQACALVSAYRAALEQKIIELRGELSEDELKDAVDSAIQATKIDIGPR